MFCTLFTKRRYISCNNRPEISVRCEVRGFYGTQVSVIFSLPTLIQYHYNIPAMNIGMIFFLYCHLWSFCLFWSGEVTAPVCNAGRLDVHRRDHARAIDVDSRAFAVPVHPRRILHSALPRRPHNQRRSKAQCFYCISILQYYPPPPITYYWTVPLILDHSYLVGKFIKFENCCYKSVRILEVLKLLFRQFLNVSSSQRDISGPIIGDLSNDRWSGGTVVFLLFYS